MWLIYIIRNFKCICQRIGYYWKNKIHRTLKWQYAMAALKYNKNSDLCISFLSHHFILILEWGSTFKKHCFLVQRLHFVLFVGIAYTKLMMCSNSCPIGSWYCGKYTTINSYWCIENDFFDCNLYDRTRNVQVISLILIFGIPKYCCVEKS